MNQVSQSLLQIPFKPQPVMQVTDKSFKPEEITVYITPPHIADEIKLFASRGFKVTNVLSAADIVVFTGGMDINPALYGERPHKRTHFSTDRDARDIKTYRASREKFKVGICRGGQFLNVFSGGKLWQHVDNHHTPHGIRDLVTGKIVMSTSVHHQAFRPAKGAVVVAVCHESTMKEAERDSWFKSMPRVNNNFATDYEALFYSDTRSLCVQGHPEWGATEAFQDYFHELISRYYNCKI